MSKAKNATRRFSAIIIILLILFFAVPASAATQLTVKVNVQMSNADPTQHRISVGNEMKYLNSGGSATFTVTDAWLKGKPVFVLWNPSGSPMGGIALKFHSNQPNAVNSIQGDPSIGQLIDLSYSKYTTGFILKTDVNPAAQWQYTSLEFIVQSPSPTQNPQQPTQQPQTQPQVDPDADAPPPEPMEDPDMMFEEPPPEPMEDPDMMFEEPHPDEFFEGEPHPEPFDMQRTQNPNRIWLYVALGIVGAGIITAIILLIKKEKH